MKKLLVALAVLCFAGAAYAADSINIPDLFSKFPALNQDVMWSLKNHQTNYGASITLVSLFKDYLHLDLGMTPQQEPIALVSVKLVDLGNIVQFPVLKYIIIEPLAYVGEDDLFSGNDKRFDYGVGVKVMSIKF
jgi:hypothetical protein